MTFHGLVVVWIAFAKQKELMKGHLNMLGMTIAVLLQTSHWLDWCSAFVWYCIFAFVFAFSFKLVCCLLFVKLSVKAVISLSRWHWWMLKYKSYFIKVLAVLLFWVHSTLPNSKTNLNQLSSVYSNRVWKWHAIKTLFVNLLKFTSDMGCELINTFIMITIFDNLRNEIIFALF